MLCIVTKNYKISLFEHFCEKILFENEFKINHTKKQYLPDSYRQMFKILLKILEIVPTYVNFAEFNEFF